MLRRHAITALGLGLSGCGGSGDSSESLPIVLQPQTARFALGAIATGTYAVNSTDGLASLAASAMGTPIPADLTRFPPIDFTQFTLLAVSYGFGGSCFNAEFVSAMLQGQTITVAHRRIELLSGASGAACFGTAAWTLYATIPRRSARVEFEQLPTRFV
jgi:hypothetical protein